MVWHQTITHDIIYSLIHTFLKRELLKSIIDMAVWDNLQPVLTCNDDGSSWSLLLTKVSVYITPVHRYKFCTYIISKAGRTNVYSIYTLFICRVISNNHELYLIDAPL